MSDANVFGLAGEGETPGDDPFAEAPEVADVEEAVTPQAVPLTPPPDTEAEPEPEPEPEAEQVLAEAEEPEPEGTPYQGRYGEKYKTIEAMEEAHRNALDLSQRQAERAKQVEEQNRQLTEYLRLAAQYIKEQQEAPKAKAMSETATETQALAEQYGVDVETLNLARKIAAEEATQRVEPIQQQLQQQQEEWQQQQYAAQAAQKAQQEIMGFRQLHADDLNEEVETEMVNIFNHFQLDPQVSDNYEIALEAARNASLLEVLKANPNYIDTDDGMNFARRLAGQHTVTAPASREAELTAARKRATVEGGNAGAPAAPTERATDPAKDPNSWEAVEALAAKDRGASVFGV